MSDECKFCDMRREAHIADCIHIDKLEDKITNLKKQIEILEKSNEFFTTKMYGQLARDTKKQLKELRGGSEE